MNKQTEEWWDKIKRQLKIPPKRILAEYACVLMGHQWDELWVLEGDDTPLEAVKKCTRCHLEYRQRLNHGGGSPASGVSGNS